MGNKDIRERIDWETLSAYIDFSAVEEFPDIPWSWAHISSYMKDISKVDEYPDAAWDWNNLSGNQYVTVEFIESHIDKPWSWLTVASHTRGVMRLVRKHPEIPWDWNNLSHNNTILPEDIVEFGDKEWCFRTVIHNVRSRPKELLDLLIRKMGVTAVIARAEEVSDDIVIENIHALSSAGWYGLSRVLHDRWHLVRRFPNERWHWMTLSTRMTVTVDILREFRNKINWRELYFRNNSFAKLMRDGGTALAVLTEFGDHLAAIGLPSEPHPTVIPLDVVLRFPHVFGWDVISRGRCGSWRNVARMPDLPWDWGILSRNPRISWFFI